MVNQDRLTPELSWLMLKPQLLFATQEARPGLPVCPGVSAEAWRSMTSA